MITNLDDLILKAHEDPKYIIESAFMVINKEKDTVPFIFNEPQTIFYNERTTRDDLLKAGQLGISTEILAILTVKFLLVPNSWSVCISHEDEATKRLFQKVQFFLDHLPPWLSRFYVPSVDSQRNLINGFTGSKFYIGTAGARAFGRGDTIHYAHLSESSRWSDAGRIMTGIMRAVPLNDPKTWIVKETTANGEGTLHHLEYKEAKDGKSDFKPHFLPFFSNPQYRIKDHNLTMEALTEQEKILLNRFPPAKAEQNKGFIDLAALAWRRKMIATLPLEAGRSRESMFKQEFPVDDTEAFLSSGNPVFPSEPLQRYKAKARSPIVVGNLEGIGEDPSVVEVEEGWLKLWDFPSTDGKYIVFGDVGEFSDYCVGVVIDRRTWKTVAKFRARMRSHAFGDELNKLGHFFNDALLAVEANNMGISTIDRLKTLKYPNLYMRERMDEKAKKVTKEVGWMTTSKTKPLMIGFMQELVGMEEVDIPDIEILNEMSTFIKTATGGMEASEGNNDDQVIATSGAYYIQKLNPIQVKVETRATTVVKVRKYQELRKPRRFGMRR